MAMRPPPPRPAPLGFWRTAAAIVLGIVLGTALGILVPYP